MDLGAVAMVCPAVGMASSRLGVDLGALENDLGVSGVEWIVEL